MKNGIVYTVGETQTRVTRCESNGCIEMTTSGGVVFDYLGEHQVQISETEDPNHHFYTDVPAVLRFEQHGPANYLEAPGPDDNIFQATVGDQVLLWDRRNPYSSIATTESNITNWRADIIQAFAELATATAVRR